MTMVMEWLRSDILPRGCPQAWAETFEPDCGRIVTFHSWYLLPLRMAEALGGNLRTGLPGVSSILTSRTPVPFDISSANDPVEDALSTSILKLCRQTKVRLPIETRKSHLNKKLAIDSPRIVPVGPPVDSFILNRRKLAYKSPVSQMVFFGKCHSYRQLYSLEGRSLQNYRLSRR